jgi:DNA polymerase III gamma/tau subunit
MSDELYKKHRPATLDEVIGQDSAVAQIRGLLKDPASFPHTLLLTGPSGCGKTTLARIIKSMIHVSDHDYEEINGSNNRGIEDMRTIAKRIGVSPMAGRFKIFYIDEAHALTSDAQNCLLKYLEDTPAHVIWILATTEPNKLKDTIRTRSTKIRCNPMTSDGISALVRDIARKEGIEVSSAILEAILDVSMNSARMALVHLNSIRNMDSEEDKLTILTSDTEGDESFKLAQAVAKSDWGACQKILREFKGDPEAARRVILGYAQSMLLRSSNAVGCHIIGHFKEPFFHVGKPGLTNACYETCHDL